MVVYYIGVVGVSKLIVTSAKIEYLLLLIISTVLYKYYAYMYQLQCTVYNNNVNLMNR